MRISKLATLDLRISEAAISDLRISEAAASDLRISEAATSDLRISEAATSDRARRLASRAWCTCGVPIYCRRGVGFPGRDFAPDRARSS